MTSKQKRASAQDTLSLAEASALVGRSKSAVLAWVKQGLPRDAARALGRRKLPAVLDPSGKGRGEYRVARTDLERAGLLRRGEAAQAAGGGREGGRVTETTGTAMIRVAELSELFQRIADWQERAIKAEAELALARRQLEEARQPRRRWWHRS